MKNNSWLAITIFCLMAMPLLGQTAVRIHLNVAEKNGKPLPVTEADLSVLSDGISVHSFKLFPLKNDRVPFAIVVDISGSNRDKTKYLRSYAETAFEILSADGSQGIICVFSDHVACSNRFLAEREFKHSISQLQPYKSGSSLLTALSGATKKLSDLAPSANVKIVVVLTDGEDTSNVSALESITESLKAGVVYLPIGMFSSGSRERRRLVAHLASATGGRAILLDEPSDVKSKLSNILKSQYVLVFDTSEGNKLESLCLIESKKKKVLVHAPKTCFAR